MSQSRRKGNVLNRLVRSFFQSSVSTFMIASLAEAINDICCPNDNYGWASAGIYSFWDYYTNEILYIGLASDLYERFRQHNGLLPISHNACKYNQINDYFKSHMKLGFTIFVQSPMYQPLVHRNKSLYEELAKKEDEPCGNYVNKQGIDSIKLVEGILIEAHKIAYGVFPPWNKVGGSVIGQNNVRENNINIVKSFCNPHMYKNNPIVARSTIRELSQNPSYAHYEDYLHAVRMLMLKFEPDYNKALEAQNHFDYFGRYKRIVDSGYLNKELIV